jgi:Flp pilus assembly protein CpaB
MSSLLVARARRLRHRPALRWVLVFGLSAVTGLFAARMVDAARAAQTRWGTGRAVVVMVDDVAAGRVIEAGDVELRSLPPAALPPSALAEPPIGRVATADLYQGEVLVEERVAPEGLVGAAALLPAGTRALAVPSGPGTPPLRVGDTVDVLGTYDPLLFEPAPVEGDGMVVSGALVIDVSDGAVTVAVDPDDASDVAFALAQGAVTLALAG